ncbi:MAG: hypothetical protein ABJI69_13205 [Balneola sp.]
MSFSPRQYMNEITLGNKKSVQGLSKNTVRKMLVHLEDRFTSEDLAEAMSKNINPLSKNEFSRSHVHNYLSRMNSLKLIKDTGEKEGRFHIYEKTENQKRFEK